jgi:hypothetical protein
MVWEYGVSAQYGGQGPSEGFPYTSMGRFAWDMEHESNRTIRCDLLEHTNTFLAVLVLLTFAQSSRSEACNCRGKVCIGSPQGSEDCASLRYSRSLPTFASI